MQPIFLKTLPRDELHVKKWVLTLFSVYSFDMFINANKQNKKKTNLFYIMKIWKKKKKKNQTKKNPKLFSFILC